MQLCSGGRSTDPSVGHDEICYEIHYCPMCEARKEIAWLQRETEKLREDLTEVLARLVQDDE